MIQLVVMDEAPLSLVRQESGVGLVIQHSSESEVLVDRLPPVCGGAGQPSDGHYFHPGPEQPARSVSPGWLLKLVLGCLRPAWSPARVSSRLHLSGSPARMLGFLTRVRWTA
jgi:hypothetical protein